jgi:hypothetical protein
MRTRQREGLTGDNKEKFQDAKYDSFFTPGAQSDDETEYKVVDNAWVKTGKFISRAPEYESVKVRFWFGILRAHYAAYDVIFGSARCVVTQFPL